MADEKEEEQKLNSMGGLIDNLSSSFMFGGGAALSQTSPLFFNNRWYMVSNDRQLLSEMYAEHGLVQVLVEQPVDDGFRGGFEIKSSQLDGNDIEKIWQYFEENKVVYSITQGMKWSRLYGGGGVLVIVPQDQETPLRLESLRPTTPIIFRAVDMWELYQDKINIEGDMSVLNPEDEYYHYYGQRVHKSRVHILKGKEAPSFIRPRLRGWGMSELERLVRSINQFLKNQNVIYELLDEAKIDVYKMEGFNSALASKSGSDKVSQRIQFANTLKNYNNALTMDAKDDYSQKVMNFSGLDAMLAQIRTGVAADLKMPVTKLFGMSAAGFNSGEDDIENYNSMIEGEVRAKCKHTCIAMVKVACQQLFGFVPEDIAISFPPLRILNAEQEENVKEKQAKRVLDFFDRGLIEALDAKKAINKDSLLSVEVTETDEVFKEDEPDEQASLDK